MNVVDDAAEQRLEFDIFGESGTAIGGCQISVRPQDHGDLLDGSIFRRIWMG